MSQVDEFIRRVATFGLPGSDNAASDLRSREPLDDRAWASLRYVADRHRLAGLLLDAIDHDQVPVTDDQRSETVELHLRWCTTVLRLERALLQVVPELTRAGLDVIALKGAAVAHLCYPDPTVRLFGDNDLLLRGDQFDHALHVLADLGYERTAPQLRAGFDRRFGKGATLRNDAGDEVDAHRNLMFGTFGFTIDLEELFRSSVDVPLGGEQLRALGPETRLLHACYHAALGDPRPRYSSVRDVAQMLAAGDHDPDEVLRLIHAWRAAPVVARAVRLCRDVLGVVPDGPIVAAVTSHAPSRQEQRAIASYVGSNRSFAAKVVASLPYLPTTRERAGFLRAALVPSRTFIQKRAAGSVVRWFRRGFRSLSRGTVRRSGRS